VPTTCRFLDPVTKKRCLVYEARPAQCRTWPFWPENMNARAWDREVVAFCPGVGKGRRTRKPPPSKVSMLFTIPATVRPLISDFNTLLTSFLSVCTKPIRRLKSDLLTQFNQCFTLFFAQRGSDELFHVDGMICVDTCNQFFAVFS